jgi:hypothetical protein
MTLISDYPIWVWALSPLIAALVTWWFYRKKGFPEMAGKWARVGMWAGRFLGLLILLLLITGPLIKTTHTVYEKPLIAIVADMSESMVMHASGKQTEAKVKELLNGLPAELREKAEVKVLAMNDGISEYTDSTGFQAKVSDFGQAFDQIGNGFGGMNLSAVLFLSDGIYNRGEDPLNAVRRLNAPVYTVAFGDSSRRNDLILSRVKHNRTAYTGNDFPIEMTVEANGFKGKACKIKVSEADKEIAVFNFNPNTQRQFLNFPLMIKAGKKGMHEYKISIENMPGEISLMNNTRTIFIEVLDNKQKVLFLARGPHPDVAAIRQMLETAEVYETTFSTADDFRGSFEPYSLVVLHQLPDASSRNKPWFNALAASSVPRWIIAGEPISAPELNQLQQVVLFSASRAKANEVAPLLNKDFRFFNQEPLWNDLVNEWSPLTVPFGSWKLANGAEALFFQRIGSVSTRDPLLAFAEPNGVRMAVLAGEGIWKWRLNEYAASAKNEAFRSLISKTIQFLAAKKDNRPFVVSGKPVYQQGEDILFDATLLNETAERISDAEIKMTITSEKGKSFPYYFSPSSMGYRLNAGQLPQGKYTWIATVKKGDLVLTDRGSFSVSDLNLESLNLTADHKLLDAMAALSGGKTLKADLKSISNEILSSPSLVSIAREEKTVKDLIDLKWLFFAMLAAFSLEWFLRRYTGGY